MDNTEKHYRVESKAVEDMHAEAAAFLATDRGKRFAKQLENVSKEMKKANGTDKYEIGLEELLYLANACENKFLEGSFDLYKLAFVKGMRYQKAKERAKA